MVYNFCTLFDSNYIHKGLALYESLSAVSDNFHLYVVAFDDECYKILKELDLQNLTALYQAVIENDELLNVKPTRNRAEYCWTAGPTMIYYFIINYNLDHCAYVDSDLMFFSSFLPIYEEIGESSIAITEHFTEKIDDLTGRFCVQYLYFRNDKDGLEALTWWRDQCINWCFARFEDGKYGDQKYLDYFPEKFNKVKILENRGVGVAPWNDFQYDFSNYGAIKFHQKFIPIVFYHFHGTKFEIRNNSLILKTITYDNKFYLNKNIFTPYLNLIKDVYNKYLFKDIRYINIEKRNIFKRFFSQLKKYFRKYSLFQFLYFKVFNIKYNGYEQNNNKS